MKQFIYFLVASFVLFSESFAKPSPAIQRALEVSWMIEVVGVSTGSGVAVATFNNGTLIFTNDHVCQSSRGINPLSGNVRYSSKLNTIPIYISNLRERHSAKIVKTSNLFFVKPPKKESDLCLLYVARTLPVAEFVEKPFEVGDELFGIGAPSGFFPSIYKGYAGALVSSRNPRSVDNPALFVSMYANHGSSGGEYSTPLEGLVLFPMELSKIMKIVVRW